MVGVAFICCTFVSKIKCHGMNKYMVIACSCVLNLNEGQKMRHYL